MFNVPQHCPTCSHGVEIREVSCPECATRVSGRWASSPLNHLSQDQRTFLTIFVRSRGNLSEVERTLGVSYPTVRAKLEDLIDVMEEAAPQPQLEPGDNSVGQSIAHSEREEILSAIARGELSVDDGMSRLQQMSEKDDA